VAEKEAQERIQALQEAAAKAEEADASVVAVEAKGPSFSEFIAAVRACDQVATAASTAASIAKIYLMIKGIEVKKFAPDSSTTGSAKIKEFQTKMEEMTKRLKDLKAKNANRRKTAYTQESQKLVKQAEELAGQAAKIVELFGEEQLAKASEDQIRAAQEDVAKASEDARAAADEAERTILEAKDIGGLTQELTDLQQRFKSARMEVDKHMRLCSTVEHRLQALQLSEQASAKIKGLEEQATKMAELVAKVMEDSEGSSLQSAEDTAGVLNKEVMQQFRHLDLQAASRDEAMRDVAIRLQERLKPVAARCEEASTSLRLHRQKVAVKLAMAECSQRVTETEAAVKTAGEAEEAFHQAAQTGSQAAALTSLETSIKAANGAINSTKSLLSLKRVEVKRLAKELSSSTMEELESLQKRVDDCTQQLAQSKKVVADRQSEVMSRELAEKLSAAEKIFEACRALPKDETEVGELSSAAEALAELERLVNRRLAMRHKDSESNPSDANAVKQVEGMKVGIEWSAELETWQNQIRENETRLATQRLIKESFEIVDVLEKKMASTEEVAAPLDDADLSATVFMKHIIKALQESFVRTGESAEAVIGKMVAEDKVLEDKFISTLQELPELQVGDKVPLFTAEELGAAFRTMLPKGQQEVSKSQFLDVFKTRYACVSAVSMTDSLAIKGSKTLRKLAPAEVLQAVGEPEKDAASGVMRVKVKSDKDGREGFVTLRAINGTTFLQTFSPHQVMTTRIELAVDEMSEALGSTAKLLDTKLASGHLAELKAEVSKLRPRIAAVQLSLNALKKKLADSKRKISAVEAAESTRKQEALDRNEAEQITQRALQGMGLVRPQIKEAIPKAEELTAKGSSIDNIEALLSSEQGLEKLYEDLIQLRRKLEEDKSSVKYARSGPLAQVWDTVSTFLAEIWTPEERCMQLLHALQEKRRRLTADAHKAVAAALREAALKEGVGVQALFDRLRKDGSTIPVQELRTFLGDSLKASELDLGLSRYVGGFSKLGLTLLLEDYMRCIKDITMTSELEVKSAKTVKKLTVGDYVKVLEPGKCDDQGMMRVRCEAVSDLVEGWVSLKGSSGTSFLERCFKPFLCCREELLLQADFETGSTEVRKLRPGQVVEVLEGPRREAATECLRVRGRAVKDGKTGFIALKDVSGDILEPIKVLVCRLSTALTTGLDVSSSKTVRKVEAGEVFEALEEAQEDEKRKLSRVKVRTYRDDKEGWVTLKGNSGTCFVESSDQHHIVKKTVPLESGFRSGSAPVRLLEEREVFELLEEPKTEKKEGDQRMRGRASASEGWFTLSKFLTPWSPRYRCIRSIELTSSLSPSSDVVRKLGSGEMVEALELPTEDDSSGLVRVRVRGEQDNSLGYVTLRDQGHVYLEALAPEKPAER
ncbi:unnamed protein product, partial [Effrenium voratum]